MLKTNFILVLGILILVGCQQESKTPTQEKTKSPIEATNNKEVKDNSIITVISIVGGLRVRDVPDVAGEIVGQMKYGQQATFLEEESETREKIELRGKMRYDNWKKIKTKDSNSNKEILGWAYGGGLMNESEMYSQKSSNQFERKIVRATQEELSDMLNIKIDDTYFFDGTVNYKKSEAGDYIKNGKFNVKGANNLEISKDFDFEVSVVITGDYNNDIPNGVFERKLVGYENNAVTTINYENGKCLWSAHMGSGEGEDYNHREENPKDCSFQYIQDRLVEVNGW